jgi:hypothetical protein
MGAPLEMSMGEVEAYGMHYADGRGDVNGNGGEAEDGEEPSCGGAAHQGHENLDHDHDHDHVDDHVHDRDEFTGSSLWG